MTKIWYPLSNDDFIQSMNEGKFVKRSHRAFAVALYYTGVRITELLRARGKQFKKTEHFIFFDVGQRLKNGLVTAPIPILLTKPFVNELEQVVSNCKPEERVFHYCRKTGYNIIRRGFATYPHRLRLTRITQLIQAGFSIGQVRSWSGHKDIGSLNPYIGMATDLKAMAEK